MIEDVTVWDVLGALGVAGGLWAVVQLFLGIWFASGRARRTHERIRARTALGEERERRAK